MQSETIAIMRGLETARAYVDRLYAGYKPVAQFTDWRTPEQKLAEATLINRFTQKV